MPLFTGPSIWVPFTPVTSWVANTTATGDYCQNGKNLLIRVHLALAGAPTSAALTINVPNSWVIDTTALPTTSTQTSLGFGNLVSNALGYPCSVVYNTTTSVTIASNGGAANVNWAIVTQAIPQTFKSGDDVDVYMTLPIVGFG